MPVTKNTMGGSMLTRLLRMPREQNARDNPSSKALVEMVRKAREDGGPFSEEEIEAKVSSVSLHPMVAETVRNILHRIGR